MLLWRGARLRSSARRSPTCRCSSTTARKKLSKRRDKVAVEDYRDEGYLPEAMRNYLALLGWSPGDNREILTLDEMVAEFRLEDVKSAGAIFDERKLQSVNAEYLRALPAAELVERSQAWLRSSLGAAGSSDPGTGPHPGRRLRHDRLPLPADRRDRPGRMGPRRPEISRLRGRARPRPSAGTTAVDEWTAAAIREATVAAGEDAGWRSSARPRPPFAWPSPDAPSDRPCGSPWRSWDGPHLGSPGGRPRPISARRRGRLAVQCVLRGWCNRQHSRFWPCHWGFELLPPEQHLV